MRIIIHDLDSFTKYTTDSPDDCKDSTDRAAFELARDLGQTITMGKIIAEPLPTLRPCPDCKGTGRDWWEGCDDADAPCDSCEGTGIHPRDLPF